MYCEYFGLKEMPFSIAPDPRYLYMSEKHREALAHLLYGVRSDNGFVLLTGEVGTGKTTVCRCFMDQVPDNTDIAFILNPKITVEELLATICDELDISYAQGSVSNKAMVDRINDYLLNEHARGRSTLLILEEAQNLSPDVLEQVRLLTNLETDERKLLQIIMLGQPELRALLSRPHMRQLSQRITARYHLDALSRDEVASYISHRLQVAGGRPKLFPRSITDTVYELSGGIPRVINLLCDRALLGTYVLGKDVVDKKTLDVAAQEVLGVEQEHVHYNRKSLWALAVLVLIMAGGLIVQAFYNPYRYATKTIIEDAPAPLQSVNAAETNVDRMQLDSIEWPSEQPVSASKLLAYKALFRQWGLDLHLKKNRTACQQAEVMGLRCLFKRGSLGSVRNLNRPAVFTFFGQEGQEFYGTLIKLTGNTGTFVIGAEEKTVDINELQSLWYGEYSLLWRIPKNYDNKMIKPGDRNSTIRWLDDQLAVLNGRNTHAQGSNVYREDLVREVIEFQRNEGLVADGIIGPQTIIRINSATDKAIPQIIISQEAN
jgi:general secretion pathway protein A